MKTKQLILYEQVPDTKSIARLRQLSVDRSGEWVLFPLNSFVVMPERREEMRSALSPLGSVEWVEDFHARFDRSVFQLGDRLERFARQVRNTRVRGKTVLEHLSGFGMKGSAWWFSLIQERNPLLYPGWNDWAKLAMIEEFLEANPFEHIVLVGVKPILADAFKDLVIERTGNVSSCVILSQTASEEARKRSVLRDLLSGSQGLLKLGKRIVQARSLRNSTDPDPLKNSKVIHIGYYPCADQSAKKQGVFKNKYLGDLQQIIEEQAASLGFLFFMVPVDGSPFRGCLKEIQRFRKKGYVMRLQEDYLGFIDWLRMLIAWSGLFCRSGMILKAVTDELIRQGILHRCESALFAQIWKESFRSHLAVKGFFNYYAFLNFVRFLPSNTQILYAAEFQSWEFMLNLATSSAGNHESIAMLQGNPARNYFQYRFDRSIKESGPAFPKKIVSFSPVFDSLHGLSECELISGSAIRLMHLQGFERQIEERRVSKGNRSLGILGAGSYDECVLMLEMLHAGLKQMSVAFSISLRLHPVISPERLSSMLSFDLQAAGIEMDTGSMSDLLSKSTAIYVSNSTSAIEALAYGCEVISPRFFGRLSLCPLDGHEAFYWRVSDDHQLADAIADIMSGKRRTATEPLTRFLSELINLDQTYSTWRRLIGK